MGAEFGQEWRDAAACADHPTPGIWFSEGHEEQAEAQRICAVCPVSAECLNFAVENNERWGIWGGVSRRARKKERQARYGMRQPRPCKLCGKAFTPKSPNGRYCSEDCSREVRRGR